MSYDYWQVILISKFFLPYNLPELDFLFIEFNFYPQFIVIQHSIQMRRLSLNYFRWHIQLQKFRLK